MIVGSKVFIFRMLRGEASLEIGLRTFYFESESE